MLSVEHGLIGGAPWRDKSSSYSSRSSNRSLGEVSEGSASTHTQASGSRCKAFPIGLPAPVPRTVEDDPDIADGIEDEPAFESCPLFPLLFIDDLGNAKDAAEYEKLPGTHQAIQVLRFLKDYLCTPFSNSRFDRPNLDAIRARNPAVIATSKEWMPYVSMVEIDGVNLVIPHIHDFFESGRVLIWIEVMASLQDLHGAVEIMKTLRRWVERATKVEQTEPLLGTLEAVSSWTTDVERVVAEYHACLKTFPGQIYYLSPTFFPKDRLIRKRLQNLAVSRGEQLTANFSERGEWGPFKFVKLPSSVTADPQFSSTDLNRFTFNPKGSVIAFRGSRQVNILSAYTGASICAFQFPRREPVSVTFTLNSSALAVSFSNAESQVIDIRTGNLVEGLSWAHNGGLSLPPTPRSQRSPQLDIPAGGEESSSAGTAVEERASAIGPHGIRASLTSLGIFTVTDQFGNTIFSRRIRCEADGDLDATSITSGGKQLAAAVKAKLNLSSTTSQSIEENVEFKCYDIGTRMAEDIVIDKLLSQLRSCDEKSVESGMDIIFNAKCTTIVLRTTNAFGANFDLLHIVNISEPKIPRVHLIYTSPQQPIAGFSVSADGDLIALCPLARQSISILMLGLGVEIYRIDLRKFMMSPFTGMTFVPGGSTLMTAHSGGQIVCWDTTRLLEHTAENQFYIPDTSRNGESTYVNAAGDTIALTSTKSTLPLVLRLDRRGNVQTPRITLPFFDRQGDSFPVALAESGTSILIGRYRCSLTDKLERRKLTVPTKAKIMRSTPTYDGKIALALLHGKQWTVRVFDSSSGDRLGEWSVPSTGITNIWGMAFNQQDNLRGVGVRMGLDISAVHFLSSRLALLGTCFLPEGHAPLNMAFTKSGSLTVLSRRVAEVSRNYIQYSAISIDVPLNPKAVVTPTVLQIRSSRTVPPAITSEGEIFYLGVGKYDGWIMRFNEAERQKTGKDMDDERVAWCPVSWRSIGNLSLFCASKGETATVICMNNELGIIAIKTM